jgi:UDP-N-acetylglucosamine acyltransferase
MMDWTHTVRGLNRVGLRRAGFGPAQIRALQRIVARLFGRRIHLGRALAELAGDEHTAEVTELLAFIRESKRGVCFGPRAGAEVEPAD